MAHAIRRWLPTAAAIGFLFSLPVASASQGFRGVIDRYGHSPHDTRYRYHGHGGSAPYSHPGHFPTRDGHFRRGVIARAAPTLVLEPVPVPVPVPVVQEPLGRAAVEEPAGPQPAGHPDVEEPAGPQPAGHPDYVRMRVGRRLVIVHRDRLEGGDFEARAAGHSAYVRQRSGRGVVIRRRSD